MLGAETRRTFSRRMGISTARAGRGDALFWLPRALGRQVATDAPTTKDRGGAHGHVFRRNSFFYACFRRHRAWPFPIGVARKQRYYAHLLRKRKLGDGEEEGKRRGVLAKATVGKSGATSKKEKPLDEAQQTTHWSLFAPLPITRFACFGPSFFAFKCSQSGKGSA